MTLELQKAYLHLLTGGYDNEKRRAVRKLFSSTEQQEEEEEEPTDADNIDIAVGILEEFYAINVQTFTAQQATQVVTIFNLEDRFHRDIMETLADHFNGPHLRLASPKENTWTVPGEPQIEKLKDRFCKIKGEDAEETPAEEWRNMTGKTSKKT